MLTTSPPWQLGYVDDGVDQVEESPGDDDAVVDIEPEHDSHGGVPDPLEKHSRASLLRLSPYKLPEGWEPVVQP